MPTCVIIELQHYIYYIPGSKNYWSDIEVTSTQYNLIIVPMCFAAWDVAQGCAIIFTIMFISIYLTYCNQYINDSRKGSNFL